MSKKALETRILDEKSFDEMAVRYNKAKSRLVFLDYDGTLTSFHEDPKEAKPDKELRALLETLSKQKGTRVVIISGRDKETLEEWFNMYPIDIIAEHGVWLKEAKKKWGTVTALTDEWKKDIKEVLEDYVNRTPGSFVEEKDYSLVWHYRKVETGLGELRTRELNSHLNYLAKNKNLQVLEGDKVVEIKSSEVNKGRAASHWISLFKSEFMFAVGDDWTDEDTFLALPKEGYTVKVGSTQSAAKYSVGSFREVRLLLSKFAQIA